MKCYTIIKLTGGPVSHFRGPDSLCGETRVSDGQRYKPDLLFRSTMTATLGKDCDLSARNAAVTADDS